MKYVTNPDDYFRILNEIPYFIFIYSSSKTCPPCRSLKKWIETHRNNDEHVYYVDMDNDDFDALCEDICALPTLKLFARKKEIESIQGFSVEKTLELLCHLESFYEATPLEEDSFDDLDDENSSVEQEQKLSSVDDILKNLKDRLNK